MKNLDYSHIYFIGIGGIGMSALARWFNKEGKKVAGYDKTATSLTSELQQEGILIHFQDDIRLIPENFKDSATTLVIYTPAIPKDHQELLYFQKNNFTILKRSQALGYITQKHKTIAIAGTHGKTTTSSMVAHILTHAGKNCTAFLGGITANYHTNLLLGDASKGEQIIVVEADEYDRSFLTLSPFIEIITNIEADHLDIYRTEEAVKEAFYEFALKNHKEGTILLNEKSPIPHLEKIQSQTQIIHYGKSKNIQLSAQNIRVDNGHFYFDLISEKLIIKDIKLLVFGEHNVENATAAAYSSFLMGVKPAVIKEALASFKGVKRRFEYIVKNDKHIFIDDYAHHPTEIEAFIKAVKAIYPHKKLTLCFQPHLYTRTRDFAEGFSKSLSMADEVLLLEIYPARELPIEGVNSKMLLKKITSPSKKVVSKEEVLQIVTKEKPELFATVGAGDIDALTGKIKLILEN
ncbi:MAG: UDP-N-acetylmuramate--L-alanine ligase [Flammeovirgaceae bacterium]